MNLILGLVGRLIFWASVATIVGHAVLVSWHQHDITMVILKLVFFPLTFLVHPWSSGLWWVFVAGIVGYWVSTFIGRMDPVG